MINSQLIRCIPLLAQIKRVTEAVGRPNVPPVMAVEIAQGRRREFGGEGHGTASGGRCNRTIVVLGRWSTMRVVAPRPVTRGQSPNVTAISHPVRRVRNAIRPLGQARSPRILEVRAVVIVHVGVGDVAEIDPAVGVVVSKQRWKRHEGLIIISGPSVSAGPSLPAGCGQGIGRGAKAKNIENHTLVISNPVVREEIAGRKPAHRNNIGLSRHPIPIHPIQYRIRHRSNRGLIGVGAIVILFGVKYPRQQQGRIDGRQLRGKGTYGGVHIQEMIEPSLVSDGP